MSRPPKDSLLGKPFTEVPASLQRVAQAAVHPEPLWIGPKDAAKLSKDESTAYDLAHKILCHLAVQAPTSHASGHPGGPLSSFTFAYFLAKLRDPTVDQPLRYSAGHLSVLAYGMQWLFGRASHDERLASPQAIIEHFRTPGGLPGHVEAGIGDIPFGTGPLGKGVSHGLGAAFGLKMQKKKGMVDVLLADGDAQEGQVIEAFRLASRLGLDNLVVHGDWNDVQLSDEPSKTVAADFAAIAAACGWQVIEVQNGNDPAQVKAAIERTLRSAGSSTRAGRPTFICYYTTMGHGIPLMEEGSNTGKANYHGSPLKSDVALNVLKNLTPLPELIKAYEKFREHEKARYGNGVATDVAIKFEIRNPKSETNLKSESRNSKLGSYIRTITSEKGAARKDFGAVHIKNLMKSDERIVVLHADLAASGGFDSVAKEFPDRVINVGVAEANMAMMAAGLRQVGMLPVTYTFAAFGTNEARANARLIDINCGHTRCGVLHDCTHSGSSVGEDGETHQEQNYLNLPFRHTQVWMPADSNQAGAMAEKAMEIIAEGHQSVFVFSGREGHPQILKADGKPFYDEAYTFTGTADILRGNGDTSDRLTIIASGATVHGALAAADAIAADHSVPATSPSTSLRAGNQQPISIRILNIACIRPIDATAIIAAALETQHLLVVEDHNIDGGIASLVADIIADFQLPCSLRRLGLRQFLPSGTAADLQLLAAIDKDSIVDAGLDELRTEVRGGEDAFVTTVAALGHNLRHSQFFEQALPFINRLQTDQAYLETLRQAWKQRSLPSEKLPTNAMLRKMLDDIASHL